MDDKDKNLKKIKEFNNKFNTCSAKLNLIFAYKSAAAINWEEAGSTTFAAVRKYAEFCNLDVIKFIINMYPDQNHDWENLEKKTNSLDEYLTLILKSLDKRSV